MKHVIIIGNGIAGSTSARYIRKYSDYAVTMISEESPEPFARTSLMYVFMRHLQLTHTHLYEKGFWEKNRIQRVYARVERLDTRSRQVFLSNGDRLTYDVLILATGSVPVMPDCPGIHLKGVQGLYHLSDLENLEKAARGGLQKAVITGGGLIGIELAEMLHSRHIDVTMLVRENSYWNQVLPAEESSMITKHIEAQGIRLRFAEELDSVRGENGRVTAVVCKNSGDVIPCDFAGITIGVKPDISLAENNDIQVNKGFLVNQYLETSVPDVYAVGDCAELISPSAGRRPVEAVWYTGRETGKIAAAGICGQKVEYNPGMWFNSAKFFDIEYQVYGDIPVNRPEDITSLFWQHDTENKSIRINYHTETGAVTGFNLMGIRYRHAVCEKWITGKTHIENVLKNLSLANFDPEFFTEYEGKIREIYQEKTGRVLKATAGRSLRNVLRFLSKKM